jgi:succinoglycan biosynthesis transport protein ExoP
MESESMNDTTDATAILAPLWRRKWLILTVAILVAAASYLYYRRQPPLYSAVTQVYLGNGAEEQSQLGTSDVGKRATAPNPTTQAALIDSSIIKEAVRDRLRHERKTRAARVALKGKTKAKGSEKSEFISIEGEAHSASGAALLVNLTAQTYIKRQNSHYRAQIENAITLARRQLRQIEAGQIQSLISSAANSKGNSAPKSTSGTASAIQAATLSSKINQLESDLGVSLITQVNPAKPTQSVLISPHPRSNALFGFAIGLLAAAFAAYALGRMDRRLHSLGAIEETLKAQVLVALRAVKRPLISIDGHPVPTPALREALWRLQTTLQVGGAAEASSLENGRGQRPRTILFVSADAGDGKSTVVAALALACAEAGERVAIVEADFRRPVQSRLLGLGGHQGLADVISGKLSLEEALQTVSLMHPQVGAAAPPQPASGGGATVVSPLGSISVLVGSTKVANPPALIGHPAASELVRTMAADFDQVLIDAPSPLQVSDVLPLLGTVDGIVIVARAGHTRATSAERLIELLQRTPSAQVLGAVANAVSSADIRKYGIHTDARPYRAGLRYNLIGR